MFESVAPRYDLLNHCLSLGLDILWRKRLVREAIKNRPQVILDLATGTGDVLLGLQSKVETYQGLAFGIDFCRPMLERARQKGAVNLCLADALNLPCKKESIDVITLAFGLRNFTQRKAFFQEAWRVLKPNGKLLILEFSQPFPWITSLYFAYLNYCIPKIALWFNASPDSYTYLGESIRRFPNKEALTQELVVAGFHHVFYRSYSLGTVALHGAYRDPEWVASEGCS